MTPHHTHSNQRLNNSGFTLIELIIATAVTGILAAIVMNFLSNQLVANAIQNARSTLMQEAQLALDVVNRDIKHAAGVDDINRWEDPYAPNAPSDLTSWEPSDQVLVLATPAKDSDSGFLYLDPFAYVTHKNNLIYFVENGTLYRRTLAADIAGNAEGSTCPQSASDCPHDTPLINNVTQFTVRYFDASDEEVTPDEARSVEVSVRITDVVYNRTLTADYAVRSVFRNE